MKHSSIGIIFGLFSFCCQQSSYANCSLSNSSIHFGSYNVFDLSAKNTVGIIQVNCLEQTLYTLKLSAGNGSYQQRYLANAQDRLYYNLYSDASMQMVWGNGFAESGVKSAQHIASIKHDVYAKIEANQNVHFGYYSDSIVVTLEY